MRFDQLRIHDAVLAILIALAASALGASYRHVLARRFAAPSTPHSPIVEAKQDPPPAQVQTTRVITKAPAGAKIFSQPETTAKPITQIKAGAVVEVSASNEGWLRVRTQAGAEGWASEDSLETEAASANAIALFDSAAQATGETVSTPRSGALYANVALTERIGSFARKDKVVILRPGGRATLVAAPDGTGGRIIAYAKTTEIRSFATPRPAPVKPDAGTATGDPLADGISAGEPPPANPGAAALKEAQDHYADGNFTEAQIKAEEAIGAGSAGAIVIAAMSACKLGELDKATRYAKRLRGAKLAQFKAACPATQPEPPKPVDPYPLQPPASPTNNEMETP